MKRLYLVLIVMLLVSIPMATMAASESEWNASCKHKTRASVTVYSLSSEPYQEEHGGYVYTYYRNIFTPIGTIPGGIYVMPVSPRTDDKYQVGYWSGGSVKYVWMDSSNLKNVSVNVKASDGKIYNIPPLAYKDYDKLKACLWDIYDDATIRMIAEADRYYSSTGGTKKAAAKVEVTIQMMNEQGEKVSVPLVTLGTVQSAVKVDGKEVTVPTTSLRWDTADETPMLAVVEAAKSGKASMRSKADGKSSTVKSVAAGRILLVLESGESYTKVSCEGKDGYMDNDVLRLIPVAAPAEEVQTGAISFKGKTKGTATVNVRLKDSKKSRVIKQFTIGTPVVVIERGDEWTEIDIDGYRGYVMNEFLNVEGE